MTCAEKFMDHTRGDPAVVQQIVNYRFAKRQSQRAAGVDLLLMSRYRKTEQRDGFLAANVELVESVERLRTDGVAHSAAMTADEIFELAEFRANSVQRICGRQSGEVDDLELAVKTYCEQVGIDFPLKIKKTDSADDIRMKVVGAVNRACDPRWWRRQISVKNRRQVESEMIRIGEVGVPGKAYVSNWGLARVEGQRSMSADMMEQIKLVRQSDQLELLLSDVAASSVANPSVRLAETIVRAKGLEDAALDSEMVGVFFTLTCPSKYHARPSNRVGVSEKWLEFGEPGPRDAIEYLKGVWARIRARWAKAQIPVMGFRVAEPHSDSCPHYHMLVFCDGSRVDEVESAFGSCAMKEDGDEPGADKHRWKAVRIDLSIGSAVGYLMKYLCKGLTGEGVGRDFDTGAGEAVDTKMHAEDAALRVRAWASIWGCRQFQFFGVASVTVWRELRRIKNVSEVENLAVAEAAILADTSRFGEYMQVVKGACLVAFAMIGVSKRYGDNVVKTVGVWVSGVVSSICVTRADVWELRPVWECPSYE